MDPFAGALITIPEDPSASPSPTPLGDSVIRSGWRRCFERKVDLNMGDDVCRAYVSGSLDGSQPVAVMIHGAGFSAISFSLFAARIRSEVACLAIDLPGHGRTFVHDDPLASKDTKSKKIDMSLGRICEFIRHAIELLVPAGTPLHLIGHSLGGSIVAKIHAENTGHKLAIQSITLIDISEGMAMSALKQMHAVLQARPRSFASLPEFSKWILTSGTVNNRRSARVSTQKSVLKEDGHYNFRADLEATEGNWDGWFDGLDAAFLGGEHRTTRMVICADTGRLDTPLTIAQMEGRFEASIIKGTGHAIHEDDPTAVALAWLTMMRRHHFTTALFTIPFCPGKINPSARAPSTSELEARDPFRA